MKRWIVLLAVVVAPLAVAPLAIAPLGVAPARAHARKEALAAFYTLQIAPRVCHWSHVGDSSKLSAEILKQERDLGVTAAERAGFLRQAEADLRADPAICAPGSRLRPVYDHTIK